MEEKNLREKSYSKNVVTYGLAVTFLGMVNMLLTCVEFASGGIASPSVVTVGEIQGAGDHFLTILVFLIMVHAVVGMIVNFIIGVSAVREAAGTQKGNTYLTLALIVMIFMAFAFVSDITSILHANTTAIGFGSMMINICYMIFMALFVHDARRLRKIHVIQRATRMSRYQMMHSLGCR